jgi:histone-lysine N-methyltransferase SETD2
MAEYIEIVNNEIVDASDNCKDNYGSSRCNCKPPIGDSLCCSDSSCINYAMQIECTRCFEKCANNRLQKRLYAQLYVLDTVGKGKGLFTAEDLKAGSFIREYVGEIISEETFRQRMLEKSSRDHIYIFQLKPGAFIDACRKGSISRFINHSCEPNCHCDIWTVNGKQRVVIVATKNIPAGTELTFDYMWRRSERNVTICRCGTPSCRGFLEVLTAEERREVETRKGKWCNRRDILSLSQRQMVYESGEGNNNCTNIVDTNGMINPYWLVNKRIKVWWDGNQAYFVGDVLYYDAKRKRHKVKYIEDQTEEMELLILDIHTPDIVLAGISKVDRDSRCDHDMRSVIQDCLNSMIDYIIHQQHNDHNSFAVGLRLNSLPITSVDKNENRFSKSASIGSVAEERNDWIWLDETQQETSIRKKVRWWRMFLHIHSHIDVYSYVLTPLSRRLSWMSR